MCVCVRVRTCLPAHVQIHFMETRFRDLQQCVVTAERDFDSTLGGIETEMTLMEHLVRASIDHPVGGKDDIWVLCHSSSGMNES